jgi:type I restriction enzyme S subunit
MSIKVKLDDVLKYEQPTNYIVESINYNNSFPIPVLTAGKSFILGYTDETYGVYNDVPVIIFDDFTTAFHYVDFPFKVKSSAMKILKPVKEKADLRYLYYKMHTISVDTDLHKRYWISKYSQLQIPLPPLEQQKKIAEILDNVDNYRQKTKALIAKYDELTQSLFLDMFGDPVKNEKGWEKFDLGNITDLITDGKHGNCSDEPKSGYYFISAKDIYNESINYERAREIPKTEFEEVDKRTNLQAGDLVMVNTGATIGKLAIAKNIHETRNTTFQKSVAVIKVKRDTIDSVFLKYVFILRLASFSGKGSGSAIQNLLLSEMRRFKIIIPPLNFQTQFAERVQAIEEQKVKAQASLEKAEDLFNSLLQRAFNGELV